MLNAKLLPSRYRRAQISLFYSAGKRILTPPVRLADSCCRLSSGSRVLRFALDPASISALHYANRFGILVSLLSEFAYTTTDAPIFDHSDALLKYEAGGWPADASCRSTSSPTPLEAVSSLLCFGT
jgi:hypothetical protein